MIKLSQRKKCDGCRCLAHNGCTIGYIIKIGIKDLRYANIKTYTPLEPCPKPLTGNDFIQAIKLYKNSKL